MWECSGNILRTNNYDPNTDTAVYLSINTSIRSNVRLCCVDGGWGTGVELQEEQRRVR